MSYLHWYFETFIAAGLGLLVYLLASLFSDLYPIREIQIFEIKEECKIKPTERREIDNPPIRCYAYGQ